MPAPRGRGYVAGASSGPSTGRGGESVGGMTIPSVTRNVAPSVGGVGSSWLDFSKVPAWRALYTAGALGYLGIFHFTLPGGLATVGRGGGGLPHGHGFAVAAYIASWLIVIDATRDIVFYAFPNQPAASALKQSV